jgi:hypothetical protein
MQIRILAALACGCVVTGLALADTVVVNDQVQVRESQVDRPKRGSTMGDVEKRFGAPVNRHPTVGAPPITRWDYNGFSVFFEHDRVIHAVATGGMAPAAGSDAPASASDAAPGAAPAPQQ